MRQILITKKMMWVVIMLLPSLAFTSAKAQDTLVLDIGKADHTEILRGKIVS